MYSIGSFISGARGFIGGIISGVGNASLTGGNVLQAGIVGAFSGAAGGLGGKYSSKLGNISINGTSLSSIKSPFIRGLIGGGLGGLGGGFASGFIGTLVAGGNFSAALNVGLVEDGIPYEIFRSPKLILQLSRKQFINMDME